MAPSSINHSDSNEMPVNGAGAPSSHRSLHVPPPLVFWACPSTTDGPELDTSPFDRVNLAFDGAFGRRTTFWHLEQRRPPSSSSLGLDTDGLEGGTRIGIGMLNIDVPVLDLAKTEWVESVTAMAVLLGFVWVCWCLGRVAWLDWGSGESKVVKEEERRLMEKRKGKEKEA